MRVEYLILSAAVLVVLVSLFALFYAPHEKLTDEEREELEALNRMWRGDAT